ncbi:MAG: outer membrane beta-barrel protein [Bacteroidales bacterium]|nr:outer membrane beta-barrel protein [Bacteroidales bacterium]
MRRVSIFALVLAFLVAAPTLLHAQIIKGEVFFGGNACQVDGDECYGFKKFGVHAGAGALIPITSFMDVGLEVLFNQKGAYKKNAHTSNSTFPYAYHLKLNYAEIPLMIYLTDKDAVSVGIGVSYGRVVGLNELVNGEPSNYEGVGIGIGDGQLHWRQNEDKLPDIGHIIDINELSEIVYKEGFPATTHVSEVIANSNTYRGNDFNICADARFRLWEGVHAELRYQYSLRPIRYRMFYEDPNLVLANQIRAQYNNSITLRVVYIFNEHRSKSNKESSKKE